MPKEMFTEIASPSANMRAKCSMVSSVMPVSATASATTYWDSCSFNRVYDVVTVIPSYS